MEAILETFGIDWRLLVIQAVNFGLLLLVLWYFLYGPLIRMLDRRKKVIEQGLKDAEDAARKLAEIEANRNITITSANQEAEHIVSEARSHGVVRGEEMVREAQIRSDRMVKDAVEKAEELKRQAIAESQRDVARLVVLGVEKMLRDKKEAS